MSLHNAAGPAAKAWIKGQPVGKAFDKAQSDFRRTQRQYDAEHPNLARASTIGGVGASLLLPGGVAVKGASLGAKALQAGRIGAAYGAMAGAGDGDGLEERGRNAFTSGLVTGTLGAAAPYAVGLGGRLAKQARLRVPGVDAAARKVEDGARWVGNLGRAATNRPKLPPVPPSVRASKQANRMVAKAISDGPIRRPGAQTTQSATPEAVAQEIERRAAMNVPAMVSEVSDPLTHTAGWASRGPGPGQRMVRQRIAERKEQQAAGLRQHIVDTMGPVVDPIAQMETHMAQAKVAAAPGYRAAYAQPMVVTPEIEAIMRTPAFREAVPQAVRNIENDMGDPLALGFRMDADGNIAGLETLSTEGFDQVARAMRDSGRAAADVNPITGRVINNTNSVHINARANELRDQLAAQNPAYADVTGRYADDMAVRDAFEQGRGVADLTGHEVNAQARALPDSAHNAWSIGARSALADDASAFATGHPNADGASRLRSILGDDIKQDAIGQMGGNTGAVRNLQDRLDAEQQGHALWQEVQRNQGATRRATTDALDAQMGGRGPGALTWRGKAGEVLSGWLDHAEPQYAKDVRDHVGRIVTESAPGSVRAMMEEIAAITQRDADLAASFQNAQLRGLKGMYATLEPNRNYSE